MTAPFPSLRAALCAVSPLRDPRKGFDHEAVRGTGEHDPLPRVLVLRLLAEIEEPRRTVLIVHGGHGWGIHRIAGLCRRSPHTVRLWCRRDLPELEARLVAAGLVVGSVAEDPGAP